MFHRLFSLASIAALFLHFMAGNTFATDRYFNDLEKTSSDGRMRLTARSPMNSGGDFRRPFASNFTYTLTDLQTGSVLWQRIQFPDEPSPVDIFVDDSSWVAVRHAIDSYSIYAPIIGDSVLTFRPLSEFPRSEHQRYVTHSTIGPLWTQGAHTYFLKTPDRWLFVVRPWWGNRVIADIDAGVLLKQNDPSVLDACKAAEILWARKDLEKDIAKVWEDGGLARDRRWKIDTAINILAMGKDIESLPLLREVARWNITYTFSRGDPPEDRQGAREYIVNHYTVASIRQMANTAIRLMGEVPDHLPSNWFVQHDEAPVGTIPRQQPDTLRHERIFMVNEGDTLKQIVEALGGPDYVIAEQREPHAIEYDMDTDEPFTLRITFDDESRVKNIEKIRPPKWKTPEGGIYHAGWLGGFRR